MHLIYDLFLLSFIAIIMVRAQEEPLKTFHLSEIFEIPCGPDKVCVQTALCNVGKVNKDGRRVIHIRLGDNECDHYLDTCCKLNNTIDSRSTTQSIGTKAQECGQANEKGVAINVEDAPNGVTQFGEFPWMVAILKDDNLICGGALISKSMVMTVAHCIHGLSSASVKVRAGEWDTATEKEPLKHEDRSVSSIIIHDNYKQEDETYFFDIALLKLAQPYELKPHINTICLSNSQPDTSFVNNTCYVTGWGKDKFGKEGMPQVFLKKIELSVVPRDICISQLRNTLLGKYFELHESFLCAGGLAGIDACEGDGGSALVCEIPGQKNRFQAVGLVAWGIECGLEAVPGVYANIPYLREWIDKNLA